MDNIKTARKIVIIDLLYLGDLIFTTPFIRNLRHNFPGARIDLVVNSNFHQLISGNPHLDNIYPYNKDWSLKKSFSFAGDLADNNYDLGLNIHGNWRSALLLKLINPGYSAGFGGRGRGLFLDKVVKVEGKQHMVEVYLQFLENIGLNVYDKELEIVVKKEARKYIADFLYSCGISNNEVIAGINTGGSWPTKRWSKKGFARLADILQSEGIRTVFVGSSKDLMRVNAIKDIMQSEPIIAAGKTDLMELAALAERCSFFISGDTGPVHVAAAVGTPTITIFGPSDDKKYRPYGEKHKIIKKDIECRPCGKHKCPPGHHRCMEEITAEEIFDIMVKV